MISAKDTFEPNTFSAMTFACGVFRGVGGIAGFRVCGTIRVEPLLTGSLIVSPLLDGMLGVSPLLGGTIEVDEDCN